MSVSCSRDILFDCIFLHMENGVFSLPVISASTASDCYECAIESVRIATKYMTPVMFLCERFLANE